MIYVGYSGVIWQTAYNTLNFFTSQLDAYNAPVSGTTAPTLAQITLVAEATGETLANGIEAINAYALNNAWISTISSLQQIAALALTLDPTTISYFNERLTAYESAQVALAPLIPQPPYGPASSTASGMVPIPSAGLVEFFSTFSFEIAPSGLTNTNVIAQSQAMASAFMTVANAIVAFQGANITQLYDIAYREYLACQSVTNLLSAYEAGGFASNITTVNTWNQVVALPAMLMSADSITGAPFTQQLQQQAVLRYAMGDKLNSIDLFLLTLRQPLATQVNVTRILNNETLIDVAARALGNFELWPQIAAINGLVPPYVAQISSPNVAGWGDQIILPAPGTQLSATGTAPSYETNYLGTDIFVGPINGAMPAWTGDFQTISGYNNYRISLGRRIQTTQGSLIYHRSYGCRIPPEVGAIQSTETAGNITAFGESAIASDPRTAKVVSAVTTLLPNGDVNFTAVAQPGGFQTKPVGVNEVISPVQ